MNDGTPKLKKHDKKFPPRRINVVDIESIEPLHKSTFGLTYYEFLQESGSGGLFSSKKSSASGVKQVLHEEHYQSRHLAEIIYAYH